MLTACATVQPSGSFSFPFVNPANPVCLTSFHEKQEGKQWTSCHYLEGLAEEVVIYHQFHPMKSKSLFTVTCMFLNKRSIWRKSRLWTNLHRIVYSAFFLLTILTYHKIHFFNGFYFMQLIFV